FPRQRQAACAPAAVCRQRITSQLNIARHVRMPFSRNLDLDNVQRLFLQTENLLQEMCGKSKYHQSIF
ncbi:hypothetical protein, partial [uncultured Desulfovibrio sp.]|uniref:hypothetical protein n=1 Tax=uncultured Desulfovibrio sp. TaxID=167968 RepID=UPI00262BD7D0